MLRTGSRSRGQALTEFIIVIPLFLILLLGVVQLSLLSFAQQMVHYAAFSAVRAAIVRPCMAFHPQNDGAGHFTPAVFTAAVLATMPATPAQQLFPDFPYDWLPLLPDSLEVEGLDWRTGPGGPGGDPGDVALNKYMNAAYLTSIQRVRPNLGDEPVTWDATNPGDGPGVPCTFWLIPDVEILPQQNVPPTGHDLTLEVTLLFPLQIPFVNRIFYGIFVNFSTLAQDELNLDSILGTSSIPEGDVMKLPTNDLPDLSRYESSVSQMVNRVTSRFRYPNEARNAGIDVAMREQGWYPLPLRARCTLPVEASVYPLVTYPWP